MMEGKSLVPQKDKLIKLKEIIPEAFAEEKIDWEKLKACLGEDINFSNERYVLNWAGKSDVFNVLQTPTYKTLAPCKSESIDFENTENIFIEGENLEVLKVLQRSYFGKVKMIYIDPPYNTGNDSFIYPDRFSESKDDYLRRVGDIDEEGGMIKDGVFRKNSKENGQYHSNWLNMIYPRLFLAKNLLRDDGVIFVSIDDNEVHNLRLLMNEIFGEENFVATIVWRGGKRNAAKYISESHDYLILYAKNLSEISERNINWKIKKSGLKAIYKKVDQLRKEFGEDYDKISIELKKWFNSLLDSDPIKEHSHYCKVDKRGIYYFDNISRMGGGTYDIINPLTGNKVKKPSRGWVFGKKEDFYKAVEQDLIVFSPDDNIPSLKRYLRNNEEQILETVFYKDRRAASISFIKLMGKGIFNFPKDVDIIKRFINATTNKEQQDIVLDFFAGSATTAQSVLELNKEDRGRRKFIMVQIPEPCDKQSEAFKAGYNTIADIAKERIRRAIKKIKDQNNGDIDFGQDKQDLGFKVFKLSESNFKQWKQVDKKDIKALEEQMKVFIDPVCKTATSEKMIYELLLKSGKELSCKLEYKNNYCCINDGELLLILEKIDQDIIMSAIKETPKKVIALDRLFKGDDQLKTNTVLQMRDAKIEFKTI